MTERETISIQNICFFDVAIDTINDCFEMTNNVFENENFEIDSEWLTNDVNNNVDLFDDKNIAKNVNIVIIVFDVKKNVDINIYIAIDVIFANSFVVILTNSFDIKKI